MLNHRAVAQWPVVAATGSRARGAHKPAPQNHCDEIHEHGPAESPQREGGKTVSLRRCGSDGHRGLRIELTSLEQTRLRTLGRRNAVFKDAAPQGDQMPGNYSFSSL